MWRHFPFSLRQNNNNCIRTLTFFTSRGTSLGSESRKSSIKTPHTHTLSARKHHLTLVSTGSSRVRVGMISDRNSDRRTSLSLTQEAPDSGGGKSALHETEQRVVIKMMTLKLDTKLHFMCAVIEYKCASVWSSSSGEGAVCQLHAIICQ